MPSNKAPPSLRILLPLPERKSSGDSFDTGEVARRWEVKTRLKHIAGPRKEALVAFRQAMLHAPTAIKVLGPMGANVKGSREINLGFDRTARVSPFIRTDDLMRAALSIESLSDTAFGDLEAMALFLCPLLGVVTPKERIPDYRCPIAANLPGIGSLHFHWRRPVSMTLDRLTRGIQVVSFLPRRLLALWAPRTDSVVSVKFSRRMRGRLQGESAAMPRLTGECLRWICEGRAGDMPRLRNFVSSNGHSLDSAASKTTTEGHVLHFVR